MSAISRRTATGGGSERRSRPRADDPRVQRTRAAVLTAARTLFLEHGYDATTMEDVATKAGLTKRTLYNNYGDKDSLFRQTVDDTVAFAESFAGGLDEEFGAGITKANLAARLEDLGMRLAVGIVRPEVIALRRLLIRASHEFPGLGRDYFARAPGRVLCALEQGFATLTRRRMLRAHDGEMAASQFAYLVAGVHLDYAVMTGDLPSRGVLETTARQGVITFLARYGPQR